MADLSLKLEQGVNFSLKKELKPKFFLSCFVKLAPTGHRLCKTYIFIKGDNLFPPGERLEHLKQKNRSC